MIIAISQPMYLPWYGIFEQILHSDYFIHYDDVQLPTSSSFITRVQINNHNRNIWLSLPVKRIDGRKTLINRCCLANTNWRYKHIKSIEHAYINAPFWDDVKDITSQVIDNEITNLADFTINSIETITRYLAIPAKFIRSSSLKTNGHKTERLISICKALGANEYLTGLGGLNYINHELFDLNGIKVSYPVYSCTSFKHISSTFTQYCSIIDFIAHKGKDTAKLFKTKFVNYKLFRS